MFWDLVIMSTRVIIDDLHGNNIDDDKELKALGSPTFNIGTTLGQQIVIKVSYEC